jgi:hypothetical protein
MPYAWLNMPIPPDACRLAMAISGPPTFAGYGNNYGIE